MQAGDVFEAAPVASVQRVAAAQKQRHRDQVVVAQTKHGEYIAGNRPAKMAEEIQRQRRIVSLLIERRDIQIVDAPPGCRVDFVAVADLAMQPCAPHVFAFLTYVLALLRLERIEKIGEIAPALVVPVELPVETRQPCIATSKRSSVGFRAEIRMRG